jgi:hypothetical protein
MAVTVGGAQLIPVVSRGFDRTSESSDFEHRDVIIIAIVKRKTTTPATAGDLLINGNRRVVTRIPLKW